MIPFEQEKIAVIGLGYVGLPVALSFGKKLPTVGFDIRQKRIDDLKRGQAAVEERARAELGMIKPGEVFYRVVEPATPPPPKDDGP